MARETKSTLAALGTVKSHLDLTDLLFESWHSVSRNMGRSLVASLGALLGCAAFVATLGLAGTAGHQISASFDVRRATEVIVEGQSGVQDPDTADVSTKKWFTNSAAEKAGTIAGVVHAGRITSLKALNIRRFFLSGDQPVSTDVFAVDTGALAAIAPNVISGRYFDAGHVRRADNVIMLSHATADQLEIDQPGSAVFIGDVGYTIIGIYNDVARVPGAAGGAIVPITQQESSGIAKGQEPLHQILLETSPGAALQVGEQAPLAISPAQPDLLVVNAPPDPKTLRIEVEASVTQLSLLVSLVTLIVGSISIGNATAVGVVLRTPEIGLRRALGARRVDIFWQLLGETASLGVFGGLVGAVLGVIITVGVSVANQWIPVLDPAVPLIAIIAGAFSGVLAGVWPALRATSITPAHALSR